MSKKTRRSPSYSTKVENTICKLLETKEGEAFVEEFNIIYSHGKELITDGIIKQIKNKVIENLYRDTGIDYFMNATKCFGEHNIDLRSTIGEKTYLNNLIIAVHNFAKKNNTTYWENNFYIIGSEVQPGLPKELTASKPADINEALDYIINDKVNIIHAPDFRNSDFKLWYETDELFRKAFISLACGDNQLNEYDYSRLTKLLFWVSESFVEDASLRPAYEQELISNYITHIEESKETNKKEIKYKKNCLERLINEWGELRKTPTEEIKQKLKKIKT